VFKHMRLNTIGSADELATGDLKISALWGLKVKGLQAISQVRDDLRRVLFLGAQA
jgi:hypothetical protein